MKPRVMATLISSVVFGCAIAHAEIWGLAIDSHKPIVAIAVRDRNIWLYDLRSGKLVRKLHPLTKEEYALNMGVRYSPDGKYIAGENAAGDEGYTTVWQTSTGRVQSRIAVRANINSSYPPFRFDFGLPPFSFAGFYGKDLGGPIRCFDYLSGSERYEGGGDDNEVFALAPNSTLIAYFSDQRQLQFWDPRLSKLWQKWSDASMYTSDVAVDDMMFSHDERVLLLKGAPDKTQTVLTIIPMPTTPPKNTDPPPHRTFHIKGFACRGMAWSSDNRDIFMVGLDGWIADFDVRLGKVVRKWRGHNGNHVRACALWNGILVTGGGSTVSLWKVPDGRLVKTFPVTDGEGGD